MKDMEDSYERAGLSSQRYILGKVWLRNWLGQ
jgi:hypothetical protein